MDRNMDLPVSKHNTSMNNSVLLQHGAIAINFMIDPFKHGLISTLKMFGYKLWYGYPHRDVFLHQLNRFSTDISDLVVKTILKTQDPEFTNLTSHEKEILASNQKETAFTRYLTKLALVEEWNMPSLINRGENGVPHQITGTTRKFATHMTKPDPWKHYPILVLDHDVNDINDLLENPTHCHDDKILHNVFGKEMTENTWDPELVIGINVSYDHYKINCKMGYIHNGYYFDHHQGRGQDLLDSHVAWRKKVGFRPKLYIHTNNPKNIRNNGAYWNVQVVPMEVDQDFINECAKRPAWLEKAVQAYRDNPTHELDAFVLWVLDDRVINIADLAWWGDDQSNVMIDADWKFILYQHEESYRCKSIRVSQAK
jgi:hypothetical protein